MIAGLCSCSGFLEKLPKTSVNPDTYVQNEDEAYSLIWGIYNCFYDYNKMSPYMIDMMTDNVYTSSPEMGVNEFAAGTQNALSTWTEHKWSTDFRAISRANYLLRKLSGCTTIDGKTKAAIAAEARFLRAWFYYDLVVFYGRVPLLDENTPIQDMPREEIDKVLAQVKDDIAFAINNLANENDPERANVGAAYGLKLRVAQYENDHKTVIECADQIEKMGYSLYGNYKNLFLEVGHDDPANKEIMFKVVYEPDLNPNCVSDLLYGWRVFHVTLEMVDCYFTANGLPITKIVASDGTEIPADPTYKPRARSFDNRDPRFYDSVLAPGQHYRFDEYGTDGDFNPLGWRAYTSFLVKKHCNEDLKSSTQDGSDRILLRYGEVLLAKAEAENELNGPEGAYAPLDELRQRVGMISVSESLPGLSQAAMRELIRNERRVELFLEGQRWSDIRRWHIAEDVMKDAHGYDYTLLQWKEENETEWWTFKVYVANKRSFNPDRDYLWPIPQTEINANSCMTHDQNPGY